jgi:hypothetical protein
MSDIVTVVCKGVTKLRADLVRAVGITLGAARELTARAVLLTTPDVLGLLEGIGLGIGGEIIVIDREVLEKSRLVHLGTGLARATVVHEDGELATGSNARALLGAGVASDEARKGNVKIQIIHHITYSIK